MIDQLQTIVRTLATPTGREVGSAGHKAARRFLCAELEAAGLAGYGDSGFEHPYTRGGVDFCNVLGVLPGSRPELNPVLIGAHYDTCGARPGADDNAAAIAIALSMVESLRMRNFERPLIFAFFDAEVPPRVEYEVTEFGLTLEPILVLMQDWGRAFKTRKLAEEPAAMEKPVE